MVKVQAKRIRVVLIVAMVGLALGACASSGGGEEATTEATHEGTQEATHEGTQEATHEGTQEATHEGTQEGTVEATHEIPERFEGLTNPFTGDAEAIAAGNVIYDDNCALCHGETGEGDGPAAPGLPHDPANFADCDWQAAEEDDHLFANIVLGEADEGMPAWGETLTEDEMWQSLAYIRSFCE